MGTDFRTSIASRRFWTFALIIDGRNPHEFYGESVEERVSYWPWEVDKLCSLLNTPADILAAAFVLEKKALNLSRRGLDCERSILAFPIWKI